MTAPRSFAYAGALASRGIAADHPILAAAIGEFTRTHSVGLHHTAVAVTALTGRLAWAVGGAAEVEEENAALLGGIGASAPLDAWGAAR